MEFEDRTLTCIDCNTEFIFTAGEQQFYRDKGFENEPKRCGPCRKAKKEARGQDFPVTCEECGKETTVPFKPTGIKPVYCRDCFDRKDAPATNHTS
ncbi:MAG: zinc-ribbon domain containing protein [Planctomycetota bacterium]|jgi:CxxC-x17-CxxC domain-containing protein